MNTVAGLRSLNGPGCWLLGIGFLLELGTFSRKLFSISFGRIEQGSRPAEAESLREFGWFQDLASVQGAWGQAGVRFSLGGVVSLPFLFSPTGFIFTVLFVRLIACLLVCLFVYPF